MDFLSLLVVYCILFVVGSLCILYRDAKVLNTGLIGDLRSHISQVRIIASRFSVYVTLYITLFLDKYLCQGAQWLSGRVLDSTEVPQVRASPASLRCGP